MNGMLNPLSKWTSSALWTLMVCILYALPALAEEPAETWAFTPRKLRPFWLSQTMEGETALFVKKSAEEPPRASLLFEPTRIVSVRSSSGAMTYKKGRDYIWKPGTKEIVLPPGSRIVFKTPEELRRPAKSQKYALTHRDGNGEILFAEGHEYQDMQTVITYRHAPGAWQGAAATFAGDRLPRTLQKLKRKQPLKIALLGDSISTGCNASGWSKSAPFQPPYQDLLVLHLKAVYGGEVTLTNFAVGGTDTPWGRTMIAKVAAEQPDLILLAFGMNDIPGGRPAAEYQANIQAMMDDARKLQPEAEFILVASMLGNKDWTIMRQELFLPYRDALAQLCRTGVALADMTSIWTEFLKYKQDWDLTGNGVNHPNDFGHRIYAQVLSALLIPKFPKD